MISVVQCSLFSKAWAQCSLQSFAIPSSRTIVPSCPKLFPAVPSSRQRSLLFIAALSCHHLQKSSPFPHCPQLAPALEWCSWLSTAVLSVGTVFFAVLSCPQLGEQCFLLFPVWKQSFLGFWAQKFVPLVLGSELTSASL